MSAPVIVISMTVVISYVGIISCAEMARFKPVIFGTRASGKAIVRVLDPFWGPLVRIIFLEPLRMKAHIPQVGQTYRGILVEFIVALRSPRERFRR